MRKMRFLSLIIDAITNKRIPKIAVIVTIPVTNVDAAVYDPALDNHLDLCFKRSFNDPGEGVVIIAGSDSSHEILYLFLSFIACRRKISSPDAIS